MQRPYEHRETINIGFSDHISYRRCMWRRVARLTTINNKCSVWSEVDLCLKYSMNILNYERRSRDSFPNKKHVIKQI